MTIDYIGCVRDVCLCKHFCKLCADADKRWYDRKQERATPLNSESKSALLVKKSSKRNDKGVKALKNDFFAASLR